MGIKSPFGVNTLSRNINLKGIILNAMVKATLLSVMSQSNTDGKIHGRNYTYKKNVEEFAVNTSVLCSYSNQQNGTPSSTPPLVPKGWQALIFHMQQDLPLT